MMQMICDFQEILTKVCVIIPRIFIKIGSFYLAEIGILKMFVSKITLLLTTWTVCHQILLNLQEIKQITAETLS